MRSRRPSGRTTRTSSGGWCSSSATSTTPRTSRRTRTCWRSIVGAVRRHRRPRLALHDRPAPGVQPPAWPPALAGGDRPGGAAAMERPDRPGPVGGPRGSRAADPDGAAAQRARRLHPGGDRRDARRAGGDGRVLALARAIGPAQGARPGPLGAVVVAGRRPAGGQSACRVARLAHHKPPDRGDRATTLIIAPRNDPTTCLSSADRRGRSLQHLGKTGHRGGPAAYPTAPFRTPPVRPLAACGRRTRRRTAAGASGRPGDAR